VGAPGFNPAGAVYLIYSTASGTGTGARVRLPYAGAPGDGFGSSLAVEGRPWAQHGMPVVGDVRIWVGVPGRDVAGQADAGAVAYYTVSASGQVSGPTLFTQNSPGVPGRPEAGDRFGQVLEPLPSGVLIGQPSEDIGPKRNAGLLTVLPAPGASPAGPGPYVASEDAPGIPGVAEAGDHFGAAIARRPGNIWVGAPGKDIGTVPDTGIVHRLTARAHQFRSLGYISQRSRNVPGANEPGDHFGASLQAGAGDLDGFCDTERVAIGTPGEDLGDIQDAGKVTLYKISAEADPFCDPAETFSQGPDARQGDHFGAAVGSAGFGDWDIGIPGQDVGSSRDVGAVKAFGLVWTLSTGARPRIHYGSVIAKYALNY
jgi:hypothetical protein